ncbi:MAG: DNA-processing protein DprA [Sedimentisphaerales bacterium]|nr:DNA-processing protein DprA [Sedimentisphaerales bacterium]
MSTADSPGPNVRDWLRLHLATGVGPKTFRKLVDHFGSASDALAANAGQLCHVPGIGKKTADAIARSRDDTDVDKEIALAQRLGVRILTLDDPDYPSLLSGIDDAPAILYVKGTLSRDDNLAVAIVGSRTPSHYGHEQAGRLGHLLAASGFTIVSGLARGIDAAAHRGALSADGRTLAVQGCGLAQVYPPEHAELADEIVRNGALVSELPLTFEPLPTTFPMRNRIISGLSLGTIVVEARPRSGALITARLAAEQNREVMAIPGRVDAPGSAGPHALIRDGAALITRVEDVLDALGQVTDLLHDHAANASAAAEAAVEEPTLFDPAPLLARLSIAERTLFDLLDHEPRHVDDLIQASALPAGDVYAACVGLQLKALVTQLPGNYFRKRQGMFA